MPSTTPRGATVRMTEAEWERAEDLARRARTSRTKVLRVALAQLDASPEEIGEMAWNLSDGKFRGGSPAASESVAANSDLAGGEARSAV